ncbi:MAG: response regulator transcription factor, partial [Ktedonobacteraceae bacterium]|nr:response regulator transcription factor [Ktedonobacteraceae bacterium]
MNQQVNILLIEDDPDIGELITLYAVKNGYSVTVANDGMTGLARFAERPPDLVLLDIMLPEMDGWEVCQEIRRFEKTPLIMLTAKGERSDKLKGFDLGTDDYVVKPFDPGELMARIKAVLRRANPLFDTPEIIAFPLLKLNLQRYQAGGFDVILGNPPWERIKIQEKEWFATRRPVIAEAPNAARRRRMIAALSTEDP